VAINLVDIAGENRHRRENMATQFSQEQIVAVGKLLIDSTRPLKERFRALFTLKNIGGTLAIDWISKAFNDDSALLKHEVAYCLGQMQDKAAVPVLTSVLENKSEEAIVRHEAAEALGAIGCDDTIDLLNKYCNDDCNEVAETCKLAVGRIQWVQKTRDLKLGDNPYHSVDPTPASDETDTDELKKILLDEQCDMFERYRAMFSLRNKGDDECVKVLGEGLKCESALFRHEIAFVLGQIASPCANQQLVSRLKDSAESPMVRHECAEALGSISSPEVREQLEQFRGLEQPEVLWQSCEIALDMADYNDSSEFQYANTLSGN